MGSRLQAIWAKVKQQWLDIWDSDKGVFFLVALGVVFFKFRDILLSILIDSAKRENTAAHKEDSTLAQQENQANQQADALVKKAADEPKNNEAVTDDWNKTNS